MMYRIMVVDDEEILLRTFSLLLEKNGYEVMTAHSGKEALQMGRRTDFHLMLCDIRMPGLSGFDTLENFRVQCSAMKKNCPPVILMSGYVSRSCEQKVRRLFPAAYSRKPFGAEDLHTAVRKVLKERSELNHLLQEVPSP